MGWHARLELQYRQQGQHTVAHDRHDGPLRVLRRLYPEGPRDLPPRARASARRHRRRRHARHRCRGRRRRPRADHHAGGNALLSQRRRTRCAARSAARRGRRTTRVAAAGSDRVRRLPGRELGALRAGARRRGDRMGHRSRSAYRPRSSRSRADALRRTSNGPASGSSAASSMRRIGACSKARSDWRATPCWPRFGWPAARHWRARSAKRCCNRHASAPRPRSTSAPAPHRPTPGSC